MTSVPVWDSNGPNLWVAVLELLIFLLICHSRAIKRLVQAREWTRDLWLNIGGLNDVFEVDVSRVACRFF